MAEDYIEYTDPEAGLRLRPVLLSQFPIEEEDGSETIADIYIWFVASMEDDSWFAVAMLEDPDDPDAATEGNNLDEILRLSIWAGKPWNLIMHSCPHCIAEDQRMRYHEMPHTIYQSMMEFPIEQLRSMRAEGEWLAFTEQIELISGVKFSLN